MKTLRTISGIKKLESSNQEVTMLQVRDILNEQRKVLINRLLADLHIYIDYRFNIKADPQQIECISEKLNAMKNYAVDLNNYGGVLQHVLDHERTHLNTEPFYKEIDENILSFLNNVPLKLVR
jgi:hypothetical protein